MALEVRERFAEPVQNLPKTVVTEPFMALLQSQERTILMRIEGLKAQGLATDGLNTLQIGCGRPKPTGYIEMRYVGFHSCCR